ncbi:hypothetical protein [Paenibacillus hexagrammi]|uniref:Lipoprotein n=1 Tax=Paenibacillus hexagrammi TaxID=2908839 RepID=A0ABY3SG57_9BACL|nr:hypothetical protein [Paenibacillus sp. YPD9-1]UJF32229.1 hypothetical protein L0M14_21265 [Paenibacillus sp. YPD9-1]
MLKKKVSILFITFLLSACQFKGESKEPQIMISLDSEFDVTKYYSEQLFNDIFYLNNLSHMESEDTKTLRTYSEGYSSYIQKDIFAKLEPEFLKITKGNYGDENKNKILEANHQITFIVTKTYDYLHSSKKEVPKEYFNQLIDLNNILQTNSTNELSLYNIEANQDEVGSKYENQIGAFLDTTIMKLKQLNQTIDEMNNK